MLLFSIYPRKYWWAHLSFVCFFHLCRSSDVHEAWLLLVCTRFYTTWLWHMRKFSVNTSCRFLTTTYLSCVYIPSSFSWVCCEPYSGLWLLISLGSYIFNNDIYVCHMSILLKRTEYPHIRHQRILTRSRNKIYSFDDVSSCLYY